MSDRHWRKYIAKLESLEEIEGVLWASELMGRVIPRGEAELLERRMKEIAVVAPPHLILRLRQRTEVRETKANGAKDV